MTDTTTPDYKPGDIANGHRLVKQPDGSMAWQPLGTEPPKKKSKWWLWLPLGVIGGVLLLIIIIGSIASATSGDNTASDSASSASDDDELTPGQQAEREAAAEEPEPEPAPPAPELGTLDNPAPAGTVITSESWDGTTYDTVAVGKVDPANDMVAQANQFNDAAAPDHRYVVVTFTVTNTTSDASKGVLPGSAVYDISLVDAATGQSFTQTMAVLNNDMSGQNEIFKGQSATGEIAFMVPNSATQLLVGSGGVFVTL